MNDNYNQLKYIKNNNFLKYQRKIGRFSRFSNILKYLKYSQIPQIIFSNRKDSQIPTKDLLAKY